MPFSTTTTPPQTKAKVTVHFAGLMLLKPGVGNRCEIGIHRFSDTHTFQIVLVVSKPGLPPTLIRLLTGPLLRPFEIKVDPDPGTGVQAFAPTPEPFDRTSTTNHAFDYRWALNLRELHPGVDFNDGARPIGTLNAGVLYTPNLTPEAIEPELVLGRTRFRLSRLSANLAVAIDLLSPGTSSDRVTVIWDEMGEAQRLTLPRSRDPEGTRYTISLLNNPPISYPLDHDEMDLYYRVLQVGDAVIPRSARRALTFVSSEPTTDEIPCSPVILHP